MPEVVVIALHFAEEVYDIVRPGSPRPARAPGCGASAVGPQACIRHPRRIRILASALQSCSPVDEKTGEVAGGHRQRLCH